MGALSLPASGVVYLDANPIIYTVEKHPVYGPLLQPLWLAARAKSIEVVSSDLALMATLVSPLKSGNTLLERQYELALLGTDMRLLPHHTSHSPGRGRIAGNDEAENPRCAACGHGSAGGLCSFCHQ